MARTWVKRNDKKYESWVLKKAVWDREKKRMRQVYLAYLGRSKRISLEKALKICEKISVTLVELKAVKRLKIIDAQRQPIRKIPVAEPVKKPRPVRDIPAMIADLRRKYDLSATLEDYQQLAMRIGVMHITPRELQIAESGHGGLSEDQLGRLEQLRTARR